MDRYIYPSEILCLPAGPHLHKDLQQITGSVWSPFMLQTLHHHPHPKEIQNFWTKWLQACGSNICGHEVIWKTGAGPPEGHHWILFSLPTEQTGLWTMQSTFEWMNEWMMHLYSAFCVLLYTKALLGLLGGHDWQGPVVGIWAGHRGYTLLFTRSAMGFLMTTESQDLGLTSHPKDDACWQYSVPITILGC